jgi:hypothetical protein
VIPCPSFKLAGGWNYQCRVTIEFLKDIDWPRKTATFSVDFGADVFADGAPPYFALIKEG